jgi:hypothetical protein
MNYGVFSIHNSFLIDREGKVRYISNGVSEQELIAFDKRIQKLFAEEANNEAAGTNTVRGTKATQH